MTEDWKMPRVIRQSPLKSHFGQMEDVHCPPPPMSSQFPSPPTVLPLSYLYLPEGMTPNDASPEAPARRMEVEEGHWIFE